MLPSGVIFMFCAANPPVDRIGTGETASIAEDT